MKRANFLISEFSIVLGVYFITSIMFFAGCGKSTEATVDSGPFEEAVAKYLDEHNMALAIKAVKEGPLVDGDTATMTASLTHAELGGASVTWKFEFEKGADDGWKAVGHQN